MKRYPTAAAMLNRNLKECTGAIGEIANLVREDTLRRDTDQPESAFIGPGTMDYLMGAVRQLTERAESIADEMEQLHQGGRRE